ncbi:hypothetical protein [Streptomyces griseoaurantiacus]|uniref:hypothetical protein n=1 Tax=Streptomyces griseoaurantiacus TaxID=68213 RepID=UPI0036A32A64
MISMSPPGAPGEAANGTNTGARGRVPGDRSATVLVGAPVPVPLALYEVLPVALYVALSVALYVSAPVAVPEEPSPCPVP